VGGAVNRVRTGSAYVRNSQIGYCSFAVITACALITSLFRRLEDGLLFHHHLDLDLSRPLEGECHREAIVGAQRLLHAGEQNVRAATLEVHLAFTFDRNGGDNIASACGGPARNSVFAVFGADTRGNRSGFDPVFLMVIETQPALRHLPSQCTRDARFLTS